MTKNNYMGKIYEDYSGTTIPNYDSPKGSRSFEQYLMEYFTANYPEILDDDIPDAFNDWLADDADIDTIIKLANKYAERIRVESMIV